MGREPKCKVSTTGAPPFFSHCQLLTEELNTGTGSSQEQEPVRQSEAENNRGVGPTWTSADPAAIQTLAPQI